MPSVLWIMRYSTSRTCANLSSASTPVQVQEDTVWRSERPRPAPEVQEQAGRGGGGADNGLGRAQVCEPERGRRDGGRAADSTDWLSWRGHSGWSPSPRHPCSRWCCSAHNKWGPGQDPAYDGSAAPTITNRHFLPTLTPPPYPLRSESLENRARVF